MLNNEFYEFIRCAIFHFYNKCNENKYNVYYSRFLDMNLDEILRDFENMYKFYMKG